MINEPMTTVPNPERSRGILWIPVLILLGIAFLRVTIDFAAVPIQFVGILSAIVSVVFVAAPIGALFLSARYPWNFLRSTLLLAVGLAIWGAGMWASHHTREPLIGGILDSVSQTGLVMWSFAIGSMLALVIRDRNSVLPIAIFLALFDMWLVFAPEGLVQQTIYQGAKPLLPLPTMAYQVPAVRTVSEHGRAHARLYVGPADYLFLSMFFVALYRLAMRPEKTFRYIAPVLILYLLTVLFFSDLSIGPIRLGALPALLPIGLVVLIVNWDLFKLNRDEKIVTLVLAIAGTAFVSWRIVQPPPPPQVVTLPSPVGPESTESQDLPGPRRKVRPPLLSPNAPRDTPGPL